MTGPRLAKHVNVSVTSVYRSTDFVKHMDHMFETQNLEAGDVAKSIPDEINISRLRSALDICVEELPPLLELGQLPEFVQAEYDFPYHRPSVLSMATESSTMMPETIGYVLLQVNILCTYMSLTLVLLNPGYILPLQTVDPDQLASSEAN